MRTLLALETSTPTCSVALHVGGQLLTREIVEPNQHSAKLATEVASLLAQAQITPAQLDGVAIGIGPGSFTGVRIALGFGQAMAFALDRPVVPVTSTEAVAQAAGVHGYETVWVALDARLGELYAAAYSRALGVNLGESDSPGWQCRLEPSLFLPTDLADLLEQQVQGCGAERICAAGDGFALHPPLASAAGGLATFSKLKPSAAAVASIAAACFNVRACSALQLQPAYVRNNVARTIEERAEDRAAERLAADQQSTDRHSTELPV
jgi:tRNA threonylcarbamoyladenosine biosynthesis protein TsaB